ncbi:MAG: type II 3-dehydroquinate dehydratase [Stygiobacter sp.]|jgi:3-dehydroquinate dehydratase-2|uniref:3-dehydroquinate dehydratase n=1 Tax=Stygiobacter electus TaxID=3032292 RepID=A0AAE3NZD9_9BACT|nr:type II 3-dehydroquinate dehydratase [Stygiobacter electus]MDF1611420.1 3-dehydroquinate dehydratase [Stygiobacter electus]
MKKICIINGPNLDIIEKREAEYYGGKNFNDILTDLKNEFPQFNFDYFQSNIEGEICKKINNFGNDISGLIINPGGFTHNSVSIRDSLSLLKIPIIEVHLSNISNRENFRRINLTTSKTIGYISGFKEFSYYAACFLMKKYLID